MAGQDCAGAGRDLFGIMSSVRQEAWSLLCVYKGRSHSNEHFAEAVVPTPVEIRNCSNLTRLSHFQCRRSDEDPAQYGGKSPTTTDSPIKWAPQFPKVDVQLDTAEGGKAAASASTRSARLTSQTTLSGQFNHECQYGHPQKEKESAAHGQKRLRQILHALDNLQQLRRKRCTPSGCNYRCRA